MVPAQHNQFSLTLNAGKPELGAVESYQTWTKEGPRSARRLLNRRVKLQRQPGAELLCLGQEGGNEPALLSAARVLYLQAEGKQRYQVGRTLELGRQMGNCPQRILRNPS